MNIIEYVFLLNSKNKIERIDFYGNENNRTRKPNYENFYGKNIATILGTIKNNQILEFSNKLYKCQIINNNPGKMVLLSNESLMKDFYKKSLDKVSNGIQIYDHNGFFLYGNPVSEALQQYDHKDFIGKHVLDIYNLSEEFSTTLTVLRSKKPVINRCDKFETNDGKALVTINSGYPIEIDNKTYGAVVFESDLSIVKKIRNRLFDFETFINDDHQDDFPVRYTFNDIIFNSKIMQEKIDFAKKIALTNNNILISGDTGTGKELFAQSIHDYSKQRNKPFIDVNCSAIPENLIESYFFGTEKGSYTGSLNKQGFFEQANGGTLFLDEINSISLMAQAKLLRVIQENRYQKVGSEEYIKCDVRIITATNENMQELMEKNKIRKDFYYRISAITIFIPKLKERKKDIIALTQYYLKKLSSKYAKDDLNISKKVFDFFMTYEWVGNVRELKHILESSVNKLSANENTIEYIHLPEFIKNNFRISHKKLYQSSDEKFIYTTDMTLKEKLESYEKEIILSVLENNSNNITKSAEKLNLSRQSLQYRIQKYALDF